MLLANMVHPLSGVNSPFYGIPLSLKHRLAIKTDRSDSLPVYLYDINYVYLGLMYTSLNSAAREIDVGLAIIMQNVSTGRSMDDRYYSYSPPTLINNVESLAYRDRVPLDPFAHIGTGKTLPVLLTRNGITCGFTSLSLAHIATHSDTV